MSVLTRQCAQTCPTSCPLTSTQTTIPLIHPHHPTPAVQPPTACPPPPPYTPHPQLRTSDPCYTSWQRPTPHRTERPATAHLCVTRSSSDPVPGHPTLAVALDHYLWWQGPGAGDRVVSHPGQGHTAAVEVLVEVPGAVTPR